MHFSIGERIFAATALAVEPPFPGRAECVEHARRSLLTAARAYNPADTNRLTAALAEYAEGAAFGIGSDWRAQRHVFDHIDSEIQPVMHDLRTRLAQLESTRQWLLGDLPTPQDIADSVQHSAAHRMAPGTWWVAPEGLPTTIDDAAVRERRQFIYDDSQTPQAVCVVEIAPGSRILEIDSADDWRNVADRYGVSGTLQTYDWGGPDPNGLRLPDWPRVAEDWDGVHLTIGGYVNATYRPIPLQGRHWTVLAGWHPGATVWFRTPPTERGA